MQVHNTVNSSLANLRGNQTIRRQNSLWSVS